jgi:hypothetical protein
MSLGAIQDEVNRIRDAVNALADQIAAYRRSVLGAATQVVTGACASDLPAGSFDNDFLAAAALAKLRARLCVPEPASVSQDPAEPKK